MTKIKIRFASTVSPLWPGIVNHFTDAAKDSAHIRIIFRSVKQFFSRQTVAADNPGRQGPHRQNAGMPPLNFLLHLHFHADTFP